MTAFNTFLVDLYRLIDGDENAPTDPQALPLATLYQVIELAERRIYREARTRFNEKAFSAYTTPVEVTGNLAPIPADFEAASVVHFGRGALKPVPEEALMEMNLVNTAGDAKYFAKAGGDLTFSPPVADETLVQGRYYCRLPALTTATAAANELFQNEYDLFIHACLLEAAPIFKKFAQMPVWQVKYDQVLNDVNKRHESAAYSAGRMQTRPSTKLMR